MAPRVTFLAVAYALLAVPAVQASAGVDLALLPRDHPLNLNFEPVQETETKHRKGDQDALQRRTSPAEIFRRQHYCDSGYGYCATFGRCCPTRDRCCTRSCVQPGDTCCSNG